MGQYEGVHIIFGELKGVFTTRHLNGIFTYDDYEDDDDDDEVLVLCKIEKSERIKLQSESRSIFFINRSSGEN